MQEPVSQDRMAVIRRWECQTCGRVLLPGDQKPRRSYHHTHGERCDGEWIEVEYVPADQFAGAVEAAAELARALRWTQEYVGDKTLPSLEGWSWFDALQKHGHYETGGQ